MIVRILGEGQFDVDDSALDSLNEIDARLQSAVEGNDEATFKSALTELLTQVRGGGKCADDYLGPSDHVLPSEDSSLEEVRDLLGEEGLLPG